MDISKFENNTYLRIETNAAFRSIDIFLFYYKDQKTYFYNATKEYEIVIEEIQKGK